MEIRSFSLGVLQTNCYVILSKGEDAAVIDPGGDPGEVVDYLKKSGRTLSKIVLSHGHADHVAGAAMLKRATGAQIYMHPDDAFFLGATNDPMARQLGLTEKISLDYSLTPGSTLSLGDVPFEVIHTPGHTQGSCCFYSQDEQVLFSGDTLFAAGIGRSDLTGGDPKQLSISLAELKKMPGPTLVYPGHGPETSIAVEKGRNRYW